MSIVEVVVRCHELSQPVAKQGPLGRAPPAVERCGGGGSGGEGVGLLRTLRLAEPTSGRPDDDRACTDRRRGAEERPVALGACPWPWPAPAPTSAAPAVRRQRCTSSTSVVVASGLATRLGDDAAAHSSPPRPSEASTPTSATALMRTTAVTGRGEAPAPDQCRQRGEQDAILGQQHDLVRRAEHRDRHILHRRGHAADHTVADADHRADPGAGATVPRSPARPERWPATMASTPAQGADPARVVTLRGPGWHGGSSHRSSATAGTPLRPRGRRRSVQRIVCGARFSVASGRLPGHGDTCIF